MTKESTIEKNQSDSIELTGLVRNMYIWQEKAFQNEADFNPSPNISADSLYTGIDWSKTDAALSKIKESNFFSSSFIKNYKDIALYIDKKLKDGSAKWSFGELPPFPGLESVAWCDCQDPPAYSDSTKIVLKNLQVNNNKADFAWSDEKGNHFNYKMKATKENGKWKISEMEGFDIKNYTISN